jgi:glycosyltransferase involved in cell wall biosynthesis
MPKVSVLMPVYNGAKYIAEAIDSIIAQTFSDWELIVYDDGSTDNTEEIVRTYSDGRIKCFKNAENKGITPTRILLIDKAESEYISFLDCDDVATPCKLQKQIDFLEENDNYAVCGSWGIMIDETGRTLKKINLATDNEALRCNLLFSSQFIQSSVVIRKSVLKDEIYNTDFPVAEDYDLWCRLSGIGYKLHNIPQYLVKYRWHGSNISETRQESIHVCTKAIFRRELIKLAIYADDDELNIHLALRDKSVQDTSNKDFLDEAWDWLEKLGGANQLCRTYNHYIFRATVCFRWLYACKERKAYFRMFCFPTPVGFKVLRHLLRQVWLKIYFL